MDINSYIADLPSVEAASFDEYAELMRLYILTAKKSDSFEGTKRLLTELYPDNAHFIYELLQNAEDAEAEEVNFEVKKDRLVFRHNGKRVFTLKDVKGITNIGNSTKKEDHTKVGKFGVGFKSVFSFTDKPIVYSDEFNFEIQDMLLPVKTSTNPNRNKGETLFEFPFKGDPSEVKKYITQIERELQSLDANTIMFLDNIKTVKYILTNGVIGDIQKKHIENNIYQIDVSSKKEKTYWLIFEKSVFSGTDKNKLHVNISYSLKNSTNGWSVVPVEGTVNIFFPAVKEKSGLRFNINGPFASTVARDSIRDCDENEIIFERLRELVVESLLLIRSSGMISMGLYEVMPNNEDVLYGKYSQMREAILEAFNENELILSVKGKCCRAQDLIKTIPSIQNLFAFDEIKGLMGYSEVDWCCTVPVRNRHCRAFFESLNIRNCSYLTLSKMFDDDHRSEFERIIQNKGISWYRNLYVVLIDMRNFFQEGKLIIQYPSLIEKMKKTNMILTMAGTLKSANEVYISKGEAPTESEQFVNERLKAFSEINSFFNFIGITEFDDSATAQFLIRELENYQYPSNDYLDKIISLAKHSSGLELVQLKEAKIWFAKGEKRKYSPTELYLDVPYEKTGFANVACVVKGLYGLSSIYKEKYSDEELQQVILFLKSLDIVSSFEIVKCDVKRNPLYHEVLYKYSDNVTAHSTGEDYTITGIEDMLDAKNVEVSRMIWNFMINLQTLPRFCKASFSPNRTTQPRRCESTLVQCLRDRAWIPCRNDNVYYKPADISRELLLDGFEWNEDSTFLSLILFGTDKNRVKIQSEKLINDWGVDTESEQAQALRVLLSNPQMAGRILNMVSKEEEEKYSLEQAIVAQSREAHSIYYDDDDEITFVRNTERRTRKLREEFEEGLKKPPVFRKIGLISRTKTSPEERLFLTEQYHGKCQICDFIIKKWNGQNYFEGINLIDTKSLDDKLKKSLETGWNSLCLCPNHAAEYKYGAIDLTDIIEKIKSIPIIERSRDKIALPIIMQGNIVEIKYTPKHFLALKTAIAFFTEDAE